MIATNRAVRQARSQVFQSGHAISTPFFNRGVSREELKGLLASPDELKGSAVIIASPFGTGKTFFIETVGQEFGIAHRDTALRVPGVTQSDLNRVSSDVLFLDEADTKSTWGRLDEGLARIGDDLGKSGRIALLLGDYALRNPALLGRLPSYTPLTTFEPLDRKFLEGVIRTRLRTYVNATAEDIIEPALYDILVPSGMARVNSLRTVLAFLATIASELPYDDGRCRITVAMARERAAKDFELALNDVAFELSPRQDEFLFGFLDHLAEHHPDGTGLEDGFDAEMMMSLGTVAGYNSWEEFVDGIIEPFCDKGVLLSRGTPAQGENGDFVRFVEPFFPSLRLMLMASQ